jgi:hypothetical protein
MARGYFATVKIIPSRSRRIKVSMTPQKVVSLYYKLAVAVLNKLNVIFDVFTAVKIQVDFFWVVIQCSGVVRYQRFGGNMDLRNVGNLSYSIRW